MKQSYGNQTPTDNQHGARHLASAAVGNQKDDEHKAKKRSDNQRSRNDLAPCLYVVRIEDYARIRSQYLFVTFYQYVLPTPIGGRRRPCRD